MNATTESLPTRASSTGAPRSLGPRDRITLQGDSFLASKVVQVAADASTAAPEQAKTTGSTKAVDRQEKRFVAPLPIVPVDVLGADAAVIQIWEGTVLSVDRDTSTITAQLRAKIGDIPEHTGEVSMQYVAEQDADLVEEGAVFYLTLYNRRLKGGTIQNSQELRFRRMPAWSKAQLANVETLAARLLTKMRPSRVAE